MDSNFTNWDFNATKGQRQRQALIKKEWDEHRKSSECMGPNCKICKEYQDKYNAESPTMN